MRARMPSVKTASSRAQIILIAVAYAAVLMVAAGLLLGRYLMELHHRADVSAAGGMYAAGDVLLVIFIACLFLIPTAFLLWYLARFETLYTTYSRCLLAFSLTSPICLAFLYLGNNRVPDTLRLLFLVTLLCSPLILVCIAVSWFVSRFDRAKKPALFALLIEALTLGVAIVLLIRG